MFCQPVISPSKKFCLLCFQTEMFQMWTILPKASSFREKRCSHVSLQGGDLSSTMAARLVPNVSSKEGESQCEEKHAVLLSPVGKLEISGCETGLHEIKLPKMSVLPSGRAESSAACEVCEGAEEMTEPLKQCTAWLRAYFCEPARMASLPLPAFHHPLLRRDSFTRQVLWTLLRDVKFGEAVSYKQLAVLAGNSRAARAVGGAMRSNPIFLGEGSLLSPDTDLILAGCE
ncbi:methylated-DNA--protein-cysteine methyltransferase isoform 5-T5 [Morphnus guianensis]